MPVTPSQAENLKYLLAEVLARPGEDMPRLVMADYLDEHGEADRAEFIRVGVEIAKTRGLLDGFAMSDISYLDASRKRVGDQLAALRRRERELTQGPLSRWRRFCEPLVDLGYGWQWSMRRGFVDTVTTEAPLWLAHGPAVCACQPVTKLVLGDPIRILPPNWEGLFAAVPKADYANHFERACATWLAWAKAEAGVARAAARERGLAE